MFHVNSYFNNNEKVHCTSTCYNNMHRAACMFISHHIHHELQETWTSSTWSSLAKQSHDIHYSKLGTHIIISTRQVITAAMAPIAPLLILATRLMSALQATTVQEHLSPPSPALQGPTTLPQDVRNSASVWTVQVVIIVQTSTWPAQDFSVMQVMFSYMHLSVPLIEHPEN